MVNIFQIMRSEYLRRLCLCFCPELRSSQVDDDLSDSFSDHFNNVCGKLELMLHFCKAQGVASEENSKVEDVKNCKSSSNTFEPMISSTCCHLQNCLIKLRRLETFKSEKFSDKSELLAVENSLNEVV